MTNDHNGPSTSQFSSSEFGASALGRFGNVQVSLSVELGKTELPLKDVLALHEGSVVSLNRLTDELLDVTANGKTIARAEVVAQDGRFALRVIELVGDGGGAEPAVRSPAGAPIHSPVGAASGASQETDAEIRSHDPAHGAAS